MISGTEKDRQRRISEPDRALGWMRGVFATIGLLGLGLTRIHDNLALGVLFLAAGLAFPVFTWWLLSDSPEPGYGTGHRDARERESG